MLNLRQATGVLRAAGESTRLRLLALCALREWSVRELAVSVQQSDPRVSRHLKVLCDAGLLRRTRRGQWVCYQAADDGDAAWLVATLLSRLDPRDDVRRRDAQRATTHVHAEADRAPRSTGLGRAVAAFIAESSAGTLVQRALCLEPSLLPLVDAVAGLARSTILVVAKPRARELLREHCERHGLECEVRATLGPVSASEDRFDAAILDLTSAPSRQVLFAALRETHARLTPAAALWIAVPYELLEHARGNVVAHPIAELRHALAACGFATEALKPIETEGTHVLVARARQQLRAASAA